MNRIECYRPSCGGLLEFVAHLRAHVPLDGLQVRVIDGELVHVGEPGDLSVEGDHDAEVLEVLVRCSRCHWTQGPEGTASYATTAALAGPDLNVDDVVWTDQNVRRTVREIHDRGDRGVEWVDEHGERWKARQVIAIGDSRCDQ